MVYMNGKNMYTSLLGKSCLQRHQWYRVIPRMLTHSHLEPTKWWHSIVSLLTSKPWFTPIIWAFLVYVCCLHMHLSLYNLPTTYNVHPIYLWIQKTTKMIHKYGDPLDHFLHEMDNASKNGVFVLWLFSESFTYWALPPLNKQCTYICSQFFYLYRRNTILLNINLHKDSTCIMPWSIVLQHPCHGIHHNILPLLLWIFLPQRPQITTIRS